MVGIRIIISSEKEGFQMDGRYNTPGEATEELKKTQAKSKQSRNPNMSEAEARLKNKGNK
jgi:hypothetical protein